MKTRVAVQMQKLVCNTKLHTHTYIVNNQVQFT